MKRLIFATILVLFSAVFSTSSEGKESDTGKQFKFRGYAGGMLLHTGYAVSNEFPVMQEGSLLRNEQIKGMPIGLGGLIKFGFGTERDMLRIGGEGYSSNLYYGQSGTYFHVGWGGILIDYIHISKGRVYPFVGVTAGGGGVKNIVTGGGSLDDFEAEPSVIRKYGIFAVAPFAGIEISVSKRFRVVVKADYLMNAGKPSPDFAQGPRIYAGFLFCK